MAKTNWKCYKKIFRDTWIRTLKSDQNLQITDMTIPGLHLRYYAVSKTIVFYLNYKVPGIRAHRNALLGKYSDSTIKEIRDRAARYRQMLYDGRDPIQEQVAKHKQQEKEQMSRKKISELIDLYHEKYSKVHKRASTLKSERYIISSRIKPKLGNICIGDLDLPILIEFYNSIAAETSFQTATNNLAIMSSFWNWCERYKYLPINSNPCHHVPRGKDKKKVFKTLDLDEYKKLMVALEDGINDKSPYSPSMFRALKLLVLTGCRTTEITKLKKRDIDLDSGFITMESSKNNEEKHPLGEVAVTEMRKAIAESPADDERLFPATRGGPNAVLDLRKAHLWALERAGLPLMRKHDFRHSFISVGTDVLGESIQAVSSTIGHKKVSTTEGYSHIKERTKLETANKIANAIMG